MVHFVSNESDLKSILADLLAPASAVFLITDSQVGEHWISPIAALVPQPDAIEIIEIEPGEDSKNIEVVGHIYTTLLERHADRKAILIALGGGVVTDLTAFIASTYKRGIGAVLIPTSLMAMADAAIGGKTGIDFADVKNAIGTFYPAPVIIYPTFLETLAEDQLRSGFAEMLKASIIADRQLWIDLTDLEEPTAENLRAFLEKAAHIKQAIVAEDPHEKGRRKILNFGHSIGHALESHYLKSGYDVSHGYCVAMGMCVETFIAQSLEVISPSESHEIVDGISWFYEWDQWPIPTFDEIAPFLHNDKKNENGKWLFALPNQIGNAIFNVEVSESSVREVWDNWTAAILNG